MKMRVILSLLLTSLIGSTFAQKITLTSGKLDFLSGVKELNLEYDYTNVAVGKYKKEDDYIKRKVADYNQEEAGKGDKWKESWYADRDNRFEPKFEELLKENLSGVAAKQDNKDAKYTMIVKTTFIEPGYNIGISRKDASINCQLIFVETASPSKKLAVITMDKIPGRGGMGYDFDTGFRIQEAYAKAGKETGKYLSKKAF